MLSLALDAPRAEAGEVVRGRVEPSDDATPVAVELVRLERSPVGTTTCFVSAADLADDGTFDLLVPDRTPPDIEGSACSLHYVVRAVSARDEVRQVLVVWA